MSFNRVITVLCPEALLDEGNALMNCLESCMPSVPVLQINCTIDDVIYAYCERYLTSSELDTVQRLIQGKHIPQIIDRKRDRLLAIREWNITDEEGKSLVDLTKAEQGISSTVMYNSADKFEMLPGKIVVVVDMRVPVHLGPLKSDPE